MAESIDPKPKFNQDFSQKEISENKSLTEDLMNIREPSDDPRLKILDFEPTLMNLTWEFVKIQILTGLLTESHSFGLNDSDFKDLKSLVLGGNPTNFYNLFKVDFEKKYRHHLNEYVTIITEGAKNHLEKKRFEQNPIKLPKEVKINKKISLEKVKDIKTQNEWGEKTFEARAVNILKMYQGLSENYEHYGEMATEGCDYILDEWNNAKDAIRSAVDTTGKRGIKGKFNSNINKYNANLINRLPNNILVDSHPLALVIETLKKPNKAWRFNLPKNWKKLIQEGK